MKANELKKIINRLVSEEVKKQLGEIFINEIKSKRSTPIQESTETSEYPTMGGKTFTTTDMADLLGYGDMKPNGGGMSNKGVAEIAHKAGVAPEQVDPDVQKAITKDYRELMSKMNLKK
tara:strand:+ start:4933 stop:5289 length:357 start_codon:yes stop_codon:yes gene_type:complete